MMAYGTLVLSSALFDDTYCSNGKVGRETERARGEGRREKRKSEREREREREGGGVQLSPQYLDKPYTL